MQTYKLLEQDSVLLSQPLLIEHFGRAGAQFLSQLHYWLEKRDTLGCKYQDSHWIYNSAESWAKQLHLSVRQIRRLISKFVESGVLRVEKLNPYKSIRTNYYSIDYDKLNASVSPKKNLETRIFVHGDILSPSSCHNGTIYIETKTTNKDINKSEAKTFEGEGQGRKINKLVDPVKQVNMMISKNKEKKEETIVGDVTSKSSLVTENLNTKVIQQKKKTTTTQDMLEIWNTILGEKAQASMSKDLAPLLLSAFHKKFEQSLNLWKSYCELIKTSPYLMGEKFQLSIFWGLKFSAIDRIRAGEFGVKPTLTKNSKGQGVISTVTENQVEQMIKALKEPLKAKATRLQIAQAVGAAAYHSWFHQADFVSKDGEIQLVAPNSFVEQVWETQFSWVKKERHQG